MRILILCTGLEGTAGAAVALSDEETFGGGKSHTAELHDNIGETSKTPLNDHSSEMEADKLEKQSEEGLSLLAKFGFAGLLLAACYGWVRVNSPRGDSRHGTYSKV